MQKIKFLKADPSTGLQKIKLNGTTYKPYTICQLADTRFGEVDKDGFSYITTWFNYKGLTYVAV
jgi:hypothetical protein|tara:strand:- start:7 stop:198 length:192 start_codon:yes stop_codon:yes gene_type:complete